MHHACARFVPFVDQFLGQCRNAFASPAQWRTGVASLKWLEQCVKVTLKCGIQIGRPFASTPGFTNALILRYRLASTAPALPDFLLLLDFFNRLRDLLLARLLFQLFQSGGNGIASSARRIGYFGCATPAQRLRLGRQIQAVLFLAQLANKQVVARLDSLSGLHRQILHHPSLIGQVIL